MFLPQINDRAGLDMLSVAKGSYTATVTDATRNVTLGSLPVGFTLTANAIVGAFYRRSGVLYQIDTTQLSVTSNVITFTSHFEDFATGDVVEVYVRSELLTGVLETKGYDASSDSMKTSELNPMNLHYLPLDLADTTNVTVADHYYPSATGTSMDGYKDLSISGKLIVDTDAITLTLEATNDEDTASADWVQVYFYDDKTNSTVNSISVTGGTVTYAISLNNMNYSSYRVKVVVGNASNTVIVKGRVKAV